jgi:hypothetical protein
MTNRKSIHYVDNQKFYREIVAYKQKLAEAEEQGLEEPRIPEYVGECIYKIAEKLSTKPCFINYSYREEMIGDGIENCILYFKDYNVDFGQNPFAYFTQIIYYAFLRRIGKEEKNRYTVYKHFQEMMSSHGSEMFTDSDGNSLTSGPLYDNINQFMDRFEKKEQAKKDRKKSAKEGLDKFYEEV